MLSKSPPAMTMLFTTTKLSPFLYLVSFLYLSSSSFALTQSVAPQNMIIRCIERERQALLDFKQSLVDEYGILSSWGSDVHQTECCSWWGVHCNISTGHVTMLDLNPTRLDDNVYPNFKQLRGRKVSPSLLELKHLNYLDLSNNDFEGSSIPEFIGSFKRLRVLSLMDANFIGTIPPQLGNLTHLQILNITALSVGLDMNLKLNLKIKNIQWLSLLSSLRSIYLKGVDIDLIESPKTSVSLPPFLEELRLPSCGIHGSLPFTLNSSSPFLSVVDFSENSLTSSSSVFHLLRNASKTLTSIDLSANNFADPIPDNAFEDMEILENLYLDSIIKDGIPKSFWNLTHLRILSLRDNRLNESIAEIFQKLSKGPGKSLQILDLSWNELNGELPANINTRFPSLRESHAYGNQLNGSIFGLPPSLEQLFLSHNKIRGLFQGMKYFEQDQCDIMYLDLSYNQITGQFPDLSHFLSLKVLDLSGNQLQGGLPETIGKLSKLELLIASSNSLEGVVTEAHFLNLTHLQWLDLSFNKALSFNFNSNWVPPFQLQLMLCANCKMGPQFPNWLRTQSKMIALDISSSDISDIIPDWFWNISKGCRYLNLSYNNIGGRLPYLPSVSSFNVIDLSSNNFWGPISLYPQSVSTLHLSKNKLVGSISFLCSIISSSTYSIDLSYNQLSGEIPNCWNYSLYSFLKVLDLANNHFSGKVPHSLGSLYRLQSLHLRNNKFTGELPSSLQNCKSLSIMDFGGNKFTGRIPSWIGGSLTDLLIVSLRHNKFYGKVPSSICHLNSIQILDLSENKLTGEIPQCFNNFTYHMKNSSSIGSTVQSLELIESAFYIDSILIQWKNQDREYKKILGLLKGIDLSSNQLTGHIPEELSALNGLISLNLSNNNLNGKIFLTIYLMEYLEVLDLSRNQLSGEIPIGLARLSFLDVLNLSNNFLSGKIPTSTQLQSFNASSYAGNIGLCGDPLPKCSPYVLPQSKNNNCQEGDSFLNREFYISMVVGFSLCFWGIVVTLVLKDLWRIAYYEFLNDVKDWLYVKMMIYLNRLQRKLRDMMI